MLVTETKTRVRFGETDKMTYVYYGNYALYYEIGRTEMLRTLGITYKDMEENGTILPVLELHVQYVKPSYYDDLLTIRTFLKEKPTARIRFDYEIYNQNNELVNKGYTILAFAHAGTFKPTRPPKYFMELIAPHFEK